MPFCSFTMNSPGRYISSGWVVENSLSVVAAGVTTLISTKIQQMLMLIRWLFMGYPDLGGKTKVHVSDNSPCITYLIWFFYKNIFLG